MHGELSRSMWNISMAMLAAISIGCSPEEAPPVAKTVDATEVIVEPGSLTLKAGSGAFLLAQANDTRGQPIGGASLRFAAPDPALLRVTELGQVTALGPMGNSFVRVTSGARERRVPVVIEAGPAARIARVSGDRQVAVAGVPPAEPLVASLVDAFGNPVANAELSLDAAVDPPIHAVATTGSDGTAVFTVPALARAGPLNLNAQLTGNSGVTASFELSVVPGPAAEIILLETPVDEAAPADSGREFAVQLRDAFANPVAGIDVQWRPAPGSGNVDPAQATSGTDGMARTRWTPGSKPVRRQSLEAVVADNETLRLVISLDK